jgi:hypothetical protein
MERLFCLLIPGKKCGSDSDVTYHHENEYCKFRGYIGEFSTVVHNLQISSGFVLDGFRKIWLPME